MSKEVHPEILEGLDYETQFIQQTASGKNRRVGGLKRGDSWLIRFIPAQMGPKKQWYARIAQHWLNKKAIFCPRQTSPEWGGNPDAYCPVCEAAERLNNDKDKEVSSFGYKLSSTPQWRTWVIVLAKAVNGGDQVDEPMSEILRPYEYNMYRSVWEELTGFVRKGARRTPLSVFDYKLGNDFWLSKVAKGTRLDKEDSAPIFDPKNPKFDEWLTKIETACKDPVVKMPTDKQLEDFADKALEEAESIGRPARGRDNGRDNGRGNGRGSSPREDEDDLPQDDAPRGRRDEDDAPRGRGRVEEQEEAPRGGTRRPPAREEEPADEQEPRGRGRVEEESPRARTTSRPAPREEEPADDRRQEEAPRGRRTSAPVEEPRTRRAAAPPPEPEDDVPMDDQPGEPEAEAEPEQPARRAAPAEATRRPSSTSGRTASPAPARTSAPASGRGGGTAQESLDADENIPEESRDQAPASRPLIDPADETALPPEEPEEAPPETPRRGALGSAIRGRVAAVTQRTK